MRLKPIGEQVVVVTGATSGIGLATARLAADRGAKLVVVARDGDALDRLAGELGDAIAVRADVGDEAQVKAVAETAVRRFGHFDTWVNNAGTSVFGHLTDVPMADHRRLMETNFWGTVYGSLAAARHFRDRRGPFAGALINVGSVLSEQSIPEQGMYCATKHAVKGFTDSLRMELAADRVPAVVMLVKPSSINTPFPAKARNYMDREPKLPPPVYATRLVARTILHCCETPERDVTVGEGKGMVIAGDVAPGLTDRLMAGVMPGLQKRHAPPVRPEGSLYAPGGPVLEESGRHPGVVFPVSPSTAATLHPVWAGLLAVGAGLAVASLVGGHGRDG